MQNSPIRANVLLVDDHPSNLLALKAVLEPLEQNLVEARSGPEALHLLAEGDFAVILLDVQMPGMDGLETAIRIKQQESSRHIPILFLTAKSADDLSVFKGYSAGAVDYMCKPLNPDILRSKVSVFIEIHRKNEKLRRLSELLRVERDHEIESLRRANEQRYRVLADSMPQIVWTATGTGLLLYRNRRWYECAGLAGEPDEPVGWEAVLYPDDVASFEKRWDRALESGEDWEGEFRFGSRKTGVYRWHLVRVLVATDGTGHRTWIGTSTDIHDRKQVEEDLLAANRAKDEFLAVLSHELRTPLNSIMGWAQVLRTRPSDESMRARALETIERNARAQAQLIADLLDVSRIVSGKLALDLAPVQVLGIVEQSLEAARPAAIRAGVRLEVEFRSRAGRVSGDAGRLQQVVGNLLSNAIKFTPRGGRVAVTLEHRGESASISVEDDGKGIDPTFLPHVFERFSQAADAAMRPRGGLGLGLAIVRHLVSAHGGQVTAESAGLGQGARFTVTLPLVNAAVRTARDSLEPTVMREPTQADYLLGVKVLLVEDDDDGRELLELVLRDYGATVRAVSSSDAALHALRTGPFDVLLSDIGLPDEDGYALIARVRSLGGKFLPAIALTAYASLDDRDRALSAGFDTHIPKPVAPRALVGAVNALARSAEGERAGMSGPSA
jgi:PAS domain S-box-containing protein